MTSLDNSFPYKKNYKIVIPNINLTFPTILPTVEELANTGHEDSRALFLLIKFRGDEGNFFDDRSFSDYAIQDFGDGKNIINLLLSKNWIKEIKPKDIILALYTASELKDFLRKRQLKLSGTKSDLVDRLLENGYKVDRRRYRHTLYELSSQGKKIIQEEKVDRDFAIFTATNCIKIKDFVGAVTAYNTYDSKWGFTHVSGKTHSIFANYEIPHSRFEFLINYPMNELQNTNLFKINLRACLIAGLMRGIIDKERLAYRFEQICSEQINCPTIIEMYRENNDGEIEDVESMLSGMQNNIDNDSKYVLKYYISKIMYLSKL